MKPALNYSLMVEILHMLKLLVAQLLRNNRPVVDVATVSCFSCVLYMIYMVNSECFTYDVKVSL